MTRDEIRIKYKLDFERDISLAKRIIDDFESRTCENCRYCDNVKERLIHCAYLEELFPKEIGKCGKWENKE